MAGPWEKYSQPAPAPSAGPWHKYSADFSDVQSSVDSGPARVPTKTQRLVDSGAIPADWQIPVEAAEQGLRSARQGLTFGFSDELSGAASGLGALLSGEDAGAAYRAARDEERALLRQFAEDYPGASALGQVGGGLLTGVAPVRSAAAAPTVVRQLGRATAAGAGVGAVSGLGAGEGNIEQQVASTAKGAAVGAAAAPIATGVAQGVGALSRLIPRGATSRVVNVRSVTSETPTASRGVLAATPEVAARESSESTRQAINRPAGLGRPPITVSEVPVEVSSRDKALDLVIDTMRRSGATAEDIEAQLIRNEELGAKPEILADFLGDQGARRLYSARTLGGSGASESIDRLAARGEGTAARVSEDVQRATSQRGQSLNQLDARIENRRRMGNNLYREAFKHGAVTSPDTLELVQNPRVAGILKKASDRRAAVADLRGESYQPLFQEGAEGPILARQPTVEDLHMLKTSLDDDIQQAYKAGEGQLGGALKQFKNRIVSGLEDEVPAYRKARETYKGDIEIEEAIANGRADILRKPVDELRRDFKELSGAEQDAYRSGAIDAILSRKVDPKVDSADFARSLWGNADSRNRLQLLVKNEDELVKLARQFEREKRIARTNRAVLGGSQTAMRESDIDETIAGTLADVATQGPTGAFVNTVQRWIRRAGGLTEPVADDVAKLLTSESPETIRAVLKTLQARDQLRIMRGINQQRTGQAAANVSAQQSTRNP